MQLTRLQVALVAMLPVAFAAAFVGATTDRAEAACHIAAFEKDAYDVEESAGKVVVTVELLGGQAECSGAVRYKTVNGSATSPADFTAKQGTLCFRAGDDRKENITVPIKGDGVAEDNESFAIKLEDIDGGIECGLESVDSVSVSGNSSTKVTIANDDAPPADGGGGGVTPSTAPEPQPDLESLAPDVTSTPEVIAGATAAETADGTNAPLAAPEESDDDGAPVGLIVGALIAAAAAATGAGVLWARSRGAGTA